MINDLINNLRVQDLTPEGRQKFVQLAGAMSPEQALAQMKHAFNQNPQLLFGMVKQELLQPHVPHAQTIGAQAGAGQQTLENRLGEYNILTELGAGGMGKVYLVEHPKMRQKFAAKVSLAQGGEDIIRFEREARNQAKLNHPNILKVHYVGTQTMKIGSGERNTPYFVMELVQGGDLNRFIYTQLLQKDDRSEISADIARQIATGLKHAHGQGVVHRDLKPANVLLTADGQAKIMDFGLAKDLTSQSLKLTQEGALLGTPVYMAPEQAIGNNDEVDEQTDIYAAGAILYEMLTGQRPYIGMNPIQILSDITDLTKNPPLPRAFDKTIPKDLETICMKAMHKDKTKRYQCAKELEEDLENYLSGEPINARPETFTEKAIRGVKRHPKIAASAVGAAVLSAILTGSSAISSHNRQRQIETITSQASSAEQRGDYTTARNLSEQILALDPLNQFAIEKRAEYAQRERNSIIEQEARRELNAALDSQNFEQAGRHLEVVRRLNPRAADLAALESRVVGYTPVAIFSESPFIIRNIQTNQIAASENSGKTLQLSPSNYLLESNPVGFATYRNIIRVERGRPVTERVMQVQNIDGFCLIAGGMSRQGVGADEREIRVQPFYLQEKHITLGDYLEFYRAATPAQRDALRPTIFHQTREPTPIDPETLEAEGVSLNRAMVLMTPNQMRSYADWYSRARLNGARVPTEAELRLAYGENSGQLYLTGNTFDRTLLRIRTPQQRREAFAEEFPDESNALRNPFGIAILELSDFCLTENNSNIAVGPALKFHRNIGDYLSAVRQTPIVTGNTYTGLRLARNVE